MKLNFGLKILNFSIFINASSHKLRFIENIDIFTTLLLVIRFVIKLIKLTFLVKKNVVVAKHRELFDTIDFDLNRFF